MPILAHSALSKAYPSINAINELQGGRKNFKRTGLNWHFICA